MFSVFTETDCHVPMRQGLALHSGKQRLYEDVRPADALLPLPLAQHFLQYIRPVDRGREAGVHAHEQHDLFYVFGRKPDVQPRVDMELELRRDVAERGKRRDGRDLAVLYIEIVPGEDVGVAVFEHEAHQLGREVVVSRAQPLHLGGVEL